MEQILCFVSDLFFISRIDSAAARNGYEASYIESAAQLAQPGESRGPDRLGEALDGPEGALIRQVAETRPGLLIFDLSASEIPWKRWIALLKTSAATRRIPILAFGSHVDADTMAAAHEAGADRVLARSRFTSDLPGLLAAHFRTPDAEGIQSACLEPLSDRALAGIGLFNRGDYFEAHEVLEEAWNEDAGPGRELYRAILQVAVAYLQIERGNYRGAVKMFLRLRQWIGPLPDVCRGVDVAGLRQAAFHVEEELLRLGESGLGGLDRSLFLPVQFRSVD